jgi:hypothetical protein
MSEETRPEGEEEEPRIQVDEDWKKAVAEEKERLKEEEEEEEEGVREATAEEEAVPPRTGPLPEPDVLTFMAGLYMQTLAALGAIENPVTGKRERNPQEASYMIDTIGMLKDKMKGNLTADEEAYVQNILTDLRMKYVAADRKPEPEAGDDAGQDAG